MILDFHCFLLTLDSDVIFHYVIKRNGFVHDVHTLLNYLMSGDNNQNGSLSVIC